MTQFQELKLDARILRGVKEAGFSEPFPIQEQAISPLLSGSDVIGQAKTGTGKTAAFALPLLQALHIQRRCVQAAVLCPTRELALQVTEDIRKLGRYMNVKVATIYGGQSITVQLEALHHGVHVMVGTPGRVIDHIRRRTLDLSSVKFVVLDEADTMLDMGFIDDVEFILNSIPRKRQLCLFAATMPPRIIELSRKYMNNPQMILVSTDEPSVDTLEQYYTVADQDEKPTALLALLKKEKPSSCIIFCRTKWGARKLAKDLERHFFNVAPLHGDLSQHQREHFMHLFRSGRADILVATDVASRGIDVPKVSLVINYNVPQDPLLYFHRVGRTARAGESGRSVTFVSSEEAGDFARIRNLTKVRIGPLKVDDERLVSANLRNVDSARTKYWRPRSGSTTRRPRGTGRRWTR